ncbi:epoxide hydrolase family protein [Microbacterium murale]|uniref:Epoxide hydrolase N-terminal domain-containing protein n=1 Tax=Microbacterium murale TaxID=1081040 RepID=A0ABQ1S256_9MICO|nr:epoxide hydrolase [Microbacterium murale]GGD88100.1 hypothetical protein GCM10007269_33580 [Microbacterium murale]
MTDSTPASSALIRPFAVAVSEAEIKDLKERLSRTRWPSPETVPDWSQGVRVENAQSLIRYWEQEYDWRRFENELNRHPQFLTEIDGVDIHFIHVRSKNPNALPLILTHGWPGSIAEFLKLIDPLTDPVAFGGSVEDSFDVVIPSLPGFGFSGKPTETGWNVIRIAKAWTALMNRLGYTHWVAQGGDWGPAITTTLGALQPDGLLGIHLNSQYAFPSQIPDTLSPEEQKALDTLVLYNGDMGGANHLQGTKPEPSESLWRTRRLARRPGFTRSSNPKPTTTGSPKTPSPPMRSSTRSRCTGSPTVPHRQLASIGRTRAAVWLDRA